MEWYTFMNKHFPDVTLNYMEEARILTFKLSIHEMVRFKMLL